MAVSAGTCAAALLIVAGQSNALGFGVTPRELPPGYRPDPLVRIWAGTRFVPMRAGVNTGTAWHPEAWGPEVEFARQWRRRNPDRALHVVKVVRGSSSLAPDPASKDWSPRTGELFAETRAQAAAARAALGGPAETVILWHQGEADAADPARAAAYAGNFAEFKARATAEWGGPGARLVAARINGALWSRSPVYQVQTRHGAYSTDGFPLQPDRLHLSGAGQIRSGAAAYSSYGRSPAQCSGATRSSRAVLGAAPAG